MLSKCVLQTDNMFNLKLWLIAFSHDEWTRHRDYISMICKQSANYNIKLIQTVMIISCYSTMQLAMPTLDNNNNNIFALQNCGSYVTHT